MATLHVMHGFIGAGKTTFAKQLEQQTGALRLNLDAWMVALFGHNPPLDSFETHLTAIRALQWQLACDLLTRGQDIILDYGFWQRAERDRLRAKASALPDVDIRFYSSSASRDVMRARALARNDTLNGETMLIEANTFDTLWPRFEPLGADEVATVF